MRMPWVKSKGEQLDLLEATAGSSPDLNSIAVDEPVLPTSVDTPAPDEFAGRPLVVPSSVCTKTSATRALSSRKLGLTNLRTTFGSEAFFSLSWCTPLTDRATIASTSVPCGCAQRSGQG